MPEQILLQGKILGTEEFLLAGSAEGRSVRSAGEELLAGKSQWITLLCEVLPRALLAELGLARILLGSSGGGQFLVVLPGEADQVWRMGSDDDGPACFGEAFQNASQLAGKVGMKKRFRLLKQQHDAGRDQRATAAL